MAELAPTLDEAGLRDTHFDDRAFERRDDICASTAESNVDRRRQPCESIDDRQHAVLALIEDLVVGQDPLPMHR